MDAYPRKHIPSDGELLDAIRKGNEEAATEFCLRHNSALLAVIVAFLAHHGCKLARDHADEVKAEVWMIIFRCLDTLKDVNKFNAWRDEIARNESRRHLLKCIPRHKTFVELNDQASLPDGRITDGQKVIETARLVNEMMERAERISSKLADIIRLRHIKGLSWDEIAAEMGENKGTLRTIYNRGIIKLRKKSGGRGG